MMKTLVVSEVFPPRKGGSGRWLWELYRRFPHGAVHVVTHSTEGGVPFDETHHLPVDRFPLHFGSWGMVGRGAAGHKYARALARLHGVVRRVAPDVIHCGKCLPEGLLAWAMKQVHGIPYVCYAHGEELTLAVSSVELRWLTRRVVDGARRIIANSRHTQMLLQRDWRVPGRRITVMHPGVDTNQWVPAPPDPRVRDQLGWAGRRVVLTVGALQKRKGQDMMIRALPAIRKSCPDVLYAIAGEGWERPYLDGLVAELGVGDLVQFVGTPPDDQLIGCFQQCDVFALPNRQIDWDLEGFGIVLLEAQACGKPVIAGASGGTSETMRVGHTGQVVPCDEPGPLADAVVALLADPARRAEMGHAARQWVADRFDWEPLSRAAIALFGGDAAPAVRADRKSVFPRPQPAPQEVCR
jgi:phosphatidylinositol alpha-1,6-mannosyltransferase